MKKHGSFHMIFKLSVELLNRSQWNFANTKKKKKNCVFKNSKLR